MNYEETLKLIDAGFTAEEIRKMAEEKPEDVPGAKDDAEGENKEPGAEVKTEPSAEINSLTEQIAKLNDTVTKLQEANIKNASTGSPKLDDPVNDKIQEFIKGL